MIFRKDPRQQAGDDLQSEAFGSDQQSGKSLLAKTAMSMAAFGVGMVVAKGAVTKVSGALGRLVSVGVQREGFITKAFGSRAGGTQRFLSNIRSSVARIDKIAARRERKTGQSTANAFLNRDFRLGNIVAHMDTYRSGSIGQLVKRSNNLEKRVFGDKGKLFHPKKVDSATGSSFTTGQLLRAHGSKYVKESGYGMAVGLGLYAYETRGDKGRGAWYSPGNIASFATTFVAGDIVFRGAMPLAKKMVDRAMSSAPGNAFRGVVARTMGNHMEGILGSLEKVNARILRSATAAIHETSSTMKATKGYDLNDKIGRITKAANIYRSNYRLHRSRSAEYSDSLKSGEHIRNTMRQVAVGISSNLNTREVDRTPLGQPNLEGSRILTRNLASGGGKARAIYLDALRDFSDSRKGGQIHSFFNKVLGRTEVTAGTTRVRASSPLNATIGESNVEIQTGIATSNDVFNLYKGKGIVDYKGKSYDLTDLYPSQMIGAAIEFMGATIKPFGHSATSLLNIASIAKLGSHHEGYVQMRSGSNVNLSRKYPVASNLHAAGKIRSGDDYLDTIGMAVRGIEVDINSPYTAASRLSPSNYFDPAKRRQWASEITQHQANANAGDANDIAFQTAANLNFGEYLVGKGENVHYVAGRLYLEQAGASRGSTNFYALGINPRSGEQMRYKSLPLVKGSTFAAVHDKLMGGGQASYTDSDGQHQSFHAGYGAPYRVDREATTVAQGFWRNIRDAYDLGGKSTPTLPTKLVNWIKAIKDPMEERNLFSKRSMRGFEMRSLRNANAQELNVYGARVTGQSASLNAATFSNMYSDSDMLELTKQYLVQHGNDDVRGAADLLLTAPQYRANIMGPNSTLNTTWLAEQGSQMQAFIERNEQMIGNHGRNSLARVIGILAEMRTSTSNDPHNVSLFSTVSKMGDRATTLSTLDDANRTILNFAFKNADNATLAGLSEHLMMNSYTPMHNIAGNVQLMKSTSDVALGQFENLFKGADPAMMDEKRQVVSNLMSVLGGNENQVDAFTKKIRPLWSMGNNDTDYIAPNIAGIRSRLFIAEDIDVGGNKLVQRSSVHNSRSPASNNLFSIAQNTEYDPVTLKTYIAGSSIDAVNNVANMVGLGFSGEATRDWSSFGQNMLTKRIMPAMAMMYAWRGADALVDDSGMFDNTALSEGLNVFVGTQFMKARLASARVLDSSGFTDFAQKAEDLMPGSMTSPLMGAVRGIGAPLLGLSLGMRFGNPVVGGAIGGIFSLLTAGGPLAAVGGYDVTKSRGQLIEEYSGRKKVPYVRDKGWIVGSNPMAGSGVEGWVPSAYARMRSQYQYTPTTYGDKMQRLMEPMLPGSIEEKNMRSRPYPLTGGAFGRRPLTGNILAVGRKELYEDELDAWGALPGLEISGLSMGFGNSAIEVDNLPQSESSTFGNVLQGMDHSFEAGSTTLAERPAISPGSVFGRANETFYRSTEFLGLRGFLMQAAYKKISGKTGATAAPFGDMPQLADGSIMTSSSNWFWDQAVGDPLGMTEFLRRLYPPQSNDNKVNPLPNTQADWLPEKYQLGDPYRAIPLGEIRLPGAGFESVNDVDFTLPGEVEMWSPDANEIAANYLFGKRDTAAEDTLKKYTKQKIAGMLSQSNQDVQLDASYFNPSMDLSGTADVAAGGSIYKVNVVSAEQFSQLDGITPDANGKLQMLGMISGSSNGVAVYVNQMTGQTKTFNTKLSKDRGMEAVQTLEKGRAAASFLMNDQKLAPNFNLGNAYSRMDRLRILNDIAPQSKEFFDTFKQVEALNQKQKSFDYENNMENIQKMNFISKQPNKMYPYRFTNVGNSAADIAYSNQIASEYSAPERFVGAAWEKVSHMNSIINKKFLNIASPYESYARNEVYGRTIKLWDKPYQHFIKPYATNVAGNNNVIDNSRSLATAGFVFGGPMGAAIGALAGGGIASYNNVTSDYHKMPEYRTQERDINQVMDMVSYKKNEQRYNESGDPIYLNRQKQTMTYVNQNLNSVSMKEYEKALPFSERKYFDAMASTPIESEREKILYTVPQSVKPGVEKLWNTYSANPTESKYMTEFGENIMEKHITPDWGGWYTGTDDNLIKIKMMNQHGLDARDVGVGWNRQMQQLSRTPLLEGKYETEFKTDAAGMQRALEGELRAILGSRISVNVAPSVGPSVTVSVVMG